MIKLYRNINQTEPCWVRIESIVLVEPVNEEMVLIHLTNGETLLVYAKIRELLLKI